MRNSRNIAINAILFALTITLTVISAAIPSPVVSIAFLMLLPTLVAAQVEKLSTAAFSGLVLGLSSLVCAFIFPKITSPIFYNPLVSVLPRIIISMVSWAAFRYVNVLIDKIAAKRLKRKTGCSDDKPTKIGLKGSKRFVFVSAFSAMTGVIANTLIVLAAIWIFYNNRVVGSMIVNAEFFTVILSTNFAIEISFCTVIVPPLVYAVKKMLKQPLNVNGYEYIKKFSDKTPSCGENESGEISDIAVDLSENAPKIDIKPISIDSDGADTSGESLNSDKL